MTMVIGSGKMCALCGEVLTLEHVWVRANFKVGSFVERYYISFCSVDCLSAFDWACMETELDWLKGHSPNNWELYLDMREKEEIRRNERTNIKSN